MTRQTVFFAIPGDLTTLTGGYIYDARVIGELEKSGYNVNHIALPSRFPFPTPADMAMTFDLLSDIPDDCPVIIDGLAFGAMDPARVAKMKCPILALVHHPLSHENGLRRTQAQQLYETEKQNLRHAAHIVVTSPHTATTLVSDFGVPNQNITIAVPGCDQPTTIGQPTQPPLILSVGNLVLRKGHDILLTALSKLTDLDWKCVIVGAPLDPVCTSQLEALHRSLDLQSRVTFANGISPKSLQLFYQDASIFALATRYEGYGMVFNEALSYGVPSVSCDVGAVADTLPHEASRLVPPDSPDEFANALRDVLSDQTLHQRLSQAAINAGADLPGWDKTADYVKSALSQTFQPTERTF